MGKDLLIMLRKIKYSRKVAFIATFLIGLAIHMFKLTNPLLTHDSYMSFYGSQNVLASGRWFLSSACVISSFFDLHWVNGILALLFIALTSVIITDLFDINNSVLATLIGGILVSALPVSCTLYYGYTADGYMMAMFFSALAVKLTANNPKKSHWILACVFLCLSCGIYQAYFSFALILTAFYFVTEVIRGNRNNKECLLYILKVFFLFMISVILYYIIWKILMKVQHVTPTSYRGISEAANIGGNSFDIGLLFNLIRVGFFTFSKHFLADIMKYGISVYAVLNIMFFALSGIGFIIVTVKLKPYKKKLQFVLALVALLLVIPFGCILLILSYKVAYYELMLQSFTLVYVFGAILFEYFVEWKHLKNLMAFLLAVIIFNNGILANIGYSYLDKANMSSFATAQQIAVRIHEFEDDFRFDKICIIGKSWDDAIGSQSDDASVALMTEYLSDDFMFDDVVVSATLSQYWNLNYPLCASDDIENKLIVKNMPIWPSQDSIKVVENVLVIKLGQFEVK